MEMAMNPSSAGASDAPSASATKPTKKLNEEDEGSVDDSDSEKPSRRSGRRKIKIEYIEDKNRRHITFSKRKAGIMKKAYELSTLTGTQVLLLVVSETGLVYTFTTVKLQPIVTKPEGKNLIQACLNAPDPVQAESSSSPVPENSYGSSSPNVADKNKAVYEDKKPEPSGFAPAPQPPQHHHQPPPGGSPAPAGYQPYVQGNWNNNHPGYMAAAAAVAAAAPYQPQQQPASQPPSQHYGAPMHSYYGNQPHHHQQQPPYLSQQHPGYWPGSSAPPQSRSHPSMARHDHPGSPAGENKADDSKPGAAN